MLILGYEPDALEREMLKVILEHEGFRVEMYQSDETVARRAKQEPGAFLILSVQDADRGLELVRRVRGGGDAPIVAIGKRQEEEISAALYEAGADEVLARPIGPRLLIARIENLRRRATAKVAESDGSERVQVGEFKLVPALLQLHVRERVVPLTPLQTRLLYHLMSNAGNIVSKSRLEDKLWGCDGEAYGQHIKTHICHLRRKLEAVAPDRCPPIETVKGTGYLFKKVHA